MMSPDHPRWAEYEARFREVAFLADETPTIHPPPDRCQHYLCLYGENGLNEAETFETLAALEARAGAGLKKRVVETGYWQDIILFAP